MILLDALFSHRDTRHRRGLTRIHTEAQLREALGGPSTSSGVNTSRDSLAQVDADWLAACPLWFLATGTDRSGDCSPRGDYPGAVYILDDKHLVLPERAGNRRGDGYANLLSNPAIGVLFVIPGRVDTLRINGQATMISDAPWYDQLAAEGVRPPLALLIDIHEVFYHCVKAFRRTHLWEPEGWDPDAAPSRQDVAAALGQAVP